MIKLLPCPFCAGKAEIERLGDRRQSTIYACTDCGCRLETGEEWGHGTRWNTRYVPSPQNPMDTASDLLRLLMARLETCTGPDRELDGELALVEGWTRTVVADEVRWLEPRDGFSTHALLRPDDNIPPRYTASVDAAMLLLSFDGKRKHNMRQWLARCEPREQDTQAIALCKAALVARIVGEK